MTSGGVESEDRGQSGETPGVGVPAQAVALEEVMLSVGRRLMDSMSVGLEGIPGGARGPQALAHTLGLDKVLTSRLLKATRQRDPMAALHAAPGPEPMRRLLRAAQSKGVDAQAVEDALEAVGRFEALIRDDLGDRAALDAIISAWLPEARRDFELRAKQSAFKAMSHIKGAMVELNLGSVVLAPSPDGEHIDVLWVIGLLGLRRLRPGVSVKMTTRRIAQGEGPRRPLTLSGQPAADLADARLDEFCDAEPAPMEVRQVGEVVHYLLGGEDFGPRSGSDIVLAEVNRAELPRFVAAGEGRKSYVFGEVGTPSRTVVLDVLVHESLYTRGEPRLTLYDTVLEGVASVNDRGRDADQLDLAERLVALGPGVAGLRLSQFPRYVELLRRVIDATGAQESAFRAYRAQIDYPIYGMQIAVSLEPEERG